MVDLARFSQPVEAIIPIVDKWGMHNGRRIRANVEDGWWLARLGDRTEILSKAGPLQLRRTIQSGIQRGIPTFSVYCLGEEGVSANFDTFFRNGLAETVRVHFLSLPLFSLAKAVRWEDGRFYFYEQVIGRNRRIIQDVKHAFEQETSLQSLRGVTPELRYYFLLASLQKQSYETVEQLNKWTLSEDERRKRVKQFQSSFPERLRDIIAKAGGTYKKYSAIGNGYIVEWEVGGQLVKSHIKDDMRIVSAGFCLSGDDKRHTVASIVNLAKLFQENRPLYITRE